MNARSDLLLQFGERVRALRLKSRISQEKLAFLCKLDRTYIGGVERGERNLSLKNIDRIATALSVTLGELMAGLDPPLIPGGERIERILLQYRESFAGKVYGAENEDGDFLMDVFGITPAIKRENRQYWGRELGMCWQRIVIAQFESTRTDFAPGVKRGSDELCDLVAGKDAIDTKYRIGSGDSGTLKKFKAYGRELGDRGFSPVLLIVRSDNLSAAISACKVSGWTIRAGEDCLAYIESSTGVEFRKWFRDLGDDFKLNR